MVLFHWSASAFVLNRAVVLIICSEMESLVQIVVIKRMTTSRTSTPISVLKAWTYASRYRRTPFPNVAVASYVMTDMNTNGNFPAGYAGGGGGGGDATRFKETPVTSTYCSVGRNAVVNVCSPHSWGSLLMISYVASAASFVSNTSMVSFSASARYVSEEPASLLKRKYDTTELTTIIWSSETPKDDWMAWPYRWFRTSVLLSCGSVLSLNSMYAVNVTVLASAGICTVPVELVDVGPLGALTANCCSSKR
mmetsp:Transcript_28746/g.80941  ORF Transcript_28746/g.80941 Transcript_28746/m.80941 type:complete len:251 (-) Transcript_28746:425-1177(-)